MTNNMEQKINNSSSKGGGREGAILSDRLNRLAPSATLGAWVNPTSTRPTILRLQPLRL